MKRTFLILSLLIFIVPSYGQTIRGNVFYTPVAVAEGSTLLNDLIAYYDFDEASGDLLDKTGNGHTGAVGAGVAQNDGDAILGTSYAFNAQATDTINCGNGDFAFTTPFTVAYWVKTLLWHCDIWGYANTDGSQGYFGFSQSGPSDGHPRFTINTSGADISVYDTDSTDIYNAWHHIAHVWTGTEVLNYVDGELDSDEDFSTTPTYDADTFFKIGKSYTNSGNSVLSGLLDEMAIYERALSQAGVDSLYNSGTGITYPFD